MAFFTNTVFISGRLARDPELRFTPGGMAVAIMILMNARKARKPTDPEIVVNIEIRAYGKQGEGCAEHLSKGSPVLVEAEMKQRTWFKEGESVPRKTHFLKVKTINFLSSAVDIPAEEENPDAIEYPEGGGTP